MESNELVRCSNCSQEYPESGVVYRCPKCGGVYDIQELNLFDSAQMEINQPGIWRYRHTFNLPANAHAVSLGEGNTPLVWAEAFDRNVALKCEYLNPTGSFKDRGSSVLVAFLHSRGIEHAIEDSSGNAGASFAAYAARAGISAKVYIPDSASGPKRQQVGMYGAEIVRIMGQRSNATEAAMRAAEGGVIYASHAYLPFNIPGYATLAYELVDQLGKAPGTVVIPVGQGGLFLGIARGMESLERCEVISTMPRLVGVQALACAPIWSLLTYGPVGFGLTGETKTVAEGISVHYPIRGDAIIRLNDSIQMEILAVDEEEILSGREHLARRGFYVEPTSAVVWNALEKGVSRWRDPIVLILTGSGLKAF